MIAWPLTLVALAAEPLQLASMPFDAARAPRELADYCTDQLAQRLGEHGVKVVTPRELSALVGLERQRQLVGCTDDSASCLAELGSALGAQGVIVGLLTQLGSTFDLSVSVMAPGTGRKLTGATARADSEEQLPAAIARLAEDLSAGLHAALGRAEPIRAASSRRHPFSLRVIVPGALGVLSGIGGGVLLGLAADRHSELVARDGAPVSYQVGASIAAEEGTFQTAGWALAIAGVVALVVAVVLFAIGEAP